MLEPSDKDREAVRMATEEAVRLGRLFCVIDDWALSRARLLIEALVSRAR
ncbi:hypothetical protein [Aquincola sp. J276]|nr:hypothetical protein [Aquincola sp. J276]MCR5864637.1 hypothetical protein [Aquincola sp. J276]